MAIKRKGAFAAAPAAKKGKVTAAVDDGVPNAAQYSVAEGMNAKLNQTNIGANNNKYYFIQLLNGPGGKHFLWTRWGRVGYSTDSKSSMMGPLSIEAAQKAFNEKFKSKTSNDWDKLKAGTPFASKAGKYTLIDVDESGDSGKKEAGKAAAKHKTPGKQKTSLTPQLAKLLAVIFDEDMFKSEMASKKVDVAKLPLGKLTKAQIAKGNAILGKLKEAIEAKKKNATKASDLSSEFYTLIPHNFGMKKPTAVDNMELWNEKVDLLNTLNDIELAQAMMGGGSDPLKDSYSKLKNNMKHMSPSDKVHKVIGKYFSATRPSSSYQLLDVFSLERNGEEARMKKHSKIGNRRLLWHGTSPAVVAAILGSGMRIMPHSGGRVGKGIYLASENSKSAGYTSSTKMDGKNVGFMFLAEAALGKSKSITRDDSSLRKAPSGFHSVLAEGRTECFDQKSDAKIQGPFGDVSVAQKAPCKTTNSSSNFSQSEYLLYEESQVLLRYLCVVKWQY